MADTGPSAGEILLKAAPDDRMSGSREIVNLGYPALRDSV